MLRLTVARWRPSTVKDGGLEPSGSTQPICQSNFKLVCDLGPRVRERRLQVMRFLRTASTRRLLAVLAGLVVAIAAETAIAVAASGPGPVPRHKPLAAAVHAALAAPAVQGISANITFSNHLIDASSLQGSDP